jgi:hypothetical protein
MSGRASRFHDASSPMSRLIPILRNRRIRLLLSRRLGGGTRTVRVLFYGFTHILALNEI